MNRMLPFRFREPGTKAGRGPLLIPAVVLACLLAVSPVASQQSGTITGEVSDVVSGQPMESASVMLDDAPRGVLTNNAGRYVMSNVPAGSHTLTFKIIGYESLTLEVEVVAGETLERNAELTKGAIRVQELVVTGVARATPRVKVPFTIEKIDVASVPVPALSAESFLVGKVPGIKVVRGGGQPGSTGDIMLRGATSISGGQAPLIVIDGVISNNSFDDLVTLDLESVEVVKGAAGASLYGSRAANGVIVIRTKRGSGFAGQDYSRIIARNEVGGDQMPGDIQLSQYHPWKIDPATGKLVDPAGEVIDDFTDPAANNPDLAGANVYESFQDGEWPSDLTLYNHIDRIYTTGRYMSNYAATEGRDGGTNYRASVERSQQGGVLPQWDDGFRRKGFRLNLDHKVRDYLSLSVSSAYNHINREDLGVSPFFDLTFMGPYVDLLKRDTATVGESHCPQDGCLIADPDPLSNQENPLYLFELLDYRDKQENVLTSANVLWTPFSWFDLEGNFGFDKNAYRERNLSPARPGVGSAPAVGGGLELTQAHTSRINGELTASINKPFGPMTTRTRMRYLQQNSHYERFWASGSDFVALDVPTLDNFENDSYRAGSETTDVRAEGVYVISMLDYKGKYIADVVRRWDGSSLFGEDERWQAYYRTAFAWRLSLEEWWPFASINEFKLHWALGTAGRRPDFSAQYETYSVGGGIITPISLGNKNLKPQRSTENEVGVDMVLFNRVTTGLTYAKTTSEDQIITVPLSKAGGFSSQVQNAGTLDNNTWEFHIEAPVINTRDVGWNLRLNLDRTRQHIAKLDLAPFRRGNFFYYREGEVFGAFYGKKWATSCDDLPDGVSCDEFQVNDDGLLVWTGKADYTQGIAGDTYLWGTTSDATVGENDVFQWGLPIAKWGWNQKDPDKPCSTRRQGEPGCTDFLYMGNTTPDVNVSLVSSFRWKGLAFYALLDGEFGGSIYNRTRQWAYRENRSRDQDQYDKSDELKKPVAYYQLLYNTNDLSSWFVESGNFVKLREVSIRYSFDPDLVDALFQGRVDQIELNLIGRNLLTFTNYTGYDPEVGYDDPEDGNPDGGSNVIGRIDAYQYPNFRTVSASLQFTF
jgi:TonB-linked SusC/RagA family outer membrane protein